jgi:O-antigen/teichoic acid export membrane protein
VSSSRHEQITPESAPRILFKNILKGSSLYSLALAGTQVASLVVIPVTTRNLSTSDYGVLDLLQQIAIIASILLSLNLSASLGYFLASRTAREERNQILWTAFFGSLAIGGIAVLLGWWLAVPISRLVFTSPDYAGYVAFSFISLPLGFALECGLSWLRFENRAPTFLAVSLTRVTVSVLATVICLAVLHLGAWGVLYSTVVASAVALFLAAAAMFRVYPPAFVFRWLGPMFRFSFPLALSGIAMFIIHFGDRFVLPHYRPISELGVYSIAYKIGMMISVLHSAFHSYWSAQVFTIAKREDSNIVLARAFSYMILILALAGLVLTLGANPALRIFTRPDYYGAARYVPILVAAYFVRAVGDFFRCLFLVQGRPSYDAACNWIGAGVCACAYFLLIPHWGALGAALATLATFIVIGGLSVAWAHRLHPYHLESVRLLKVAIAAGLPLAVFFLFPQDHAPVLRQIAWGTALILVFPTLLIAFKFPTPGETELARSSLHALRTRLRWQA